jgi:hypothetical protein
VPGVLCTRDKEDRMASARRIIRIPALLGLVVLLMVATVTPAAAASKSGTVSCSGGKTVNISSRASVWVTHYWSGPHSDTWYNPYRTLHVSWTNYSSTWYTIEYDFEIQSWSGYCVQ